MIAFIWKLKENKLSGEHIGKNIFNIHAKIELNLPKIRIYPYKIKNKIKCNIKIKVNELTLQ